jgi:transcription-repair coupling factor (superfamily II helicase)
VILATANSVLQRVPPRDVIKAASFSAAPGNRVNTEELQDYLVKNGFSRTGTVVDPGDYAIRGGIIDIFPPGHEEPVRLDFFGDTLESCAASTLRRSAPPISSSSSSWMQPARYC